MQNSAHDANEYAVLRSTEAARYLGVSSEQLRLSRHTGELFKGINTPAFMKVGCAVRYRRCTLDAWLAALPEYGRTSEYQMHGKPALRDPATTSPPNIDRTEP